MLGVKDLHLLDYREDLTPAGIAYLVRQLQHLGARRSNLDFNALRQQVAEKAAELALIRYLAQCEVPHQVSAVRSLASRASGISLGGRPLFLHVELLSQPRAIERTLKRPEQHLQQPFTLDTATLEDAQALDGVHLAVRLLGEVTKGPRELREPHYLMIPLSADWARPAAWRPLGELAFKLEAGGPLDLEFGGLDGERRFVKSELTLKPGERQVLTGEFYSLSYLRATTLPGGRLGVHSAGTGLRHIAAPKEWGNLWIYGQQIALLGYLSGSDLLDTRQGQRLAMEQLRPLDDLFARAQAWAGQGKTAR